ncbi:MAG: hypothetical protein ACFCD0_22870 [Gemmataceae bacterium]
MKYSHTQRGKLDILLMVVALACFVPAFYIHDPSAYWLSGGVGVILLFAAACFSWLRVEDEGDHLKIQYGPLPVFSKRIPYGIIHEIHEEKSALIDGWGIHYIPLRGWTYNLWGFDCVRLKTTMGTIRVGTDDPQGLAEFLRQKLEPVNA